jgi:hypothetical protein
MCFFKAFSAELQVTKRNCLGLVEQPDHRLNRCWLNSGSHTGTQKPETQHNPPGGPETGPYSILETYTYSLGCKWQKMGERRAQPHGGFKSTSKERSRSWRQDDQHEVTHKCTSPYRQAWVCLVRQRKQRRAARRKPFPQREMVLRPGQQIINRTCT